MQHNSRIMKLLSLSVSLLFLFSMVSCGGSGSSGTSLTSTEKAAAGSTAAAGSIQLSGTIAGSADLASGTIPAGYKPGINKTVDTSAIGKIDPRLKTIVDKMVAELQKPVIQNTMSKPRYKTMSAAGTAGASCAYGGTYSITYNSSSTLVSGTTTTTDSLSVTFTTCGSFDSNSGTYSMLSGSMTGTHVFDSNNNDSANLNVNNLTDKEYSSYPFVSGSEDAIFTMNGDFTSVNNNGTSGNASALGSLTLTLPASSVAMTFTIGSGGIPVTDVWTDTAPLSNGTVTHTGTGTFILSATAPGQSITLNITLSSLQDKITTSGLGDTDEWINGTVTISWSPDLSQWGCANGSYVFTTAAGTPIHTAYTDYCPSSGTVQVNNATLQFHADYTITVTVTDSNGSVSEVFPDCSSLGQGMCG